MDKKKAIFPLLVIAWTAVLGVLANFLLPPPPPSAAEYAVLVLFGIALTFLTQGAWKLVRRKLQKTHEEGEHDRAADAETPQKAP